MARGDTAKPKGELVAALDIGSAKVCCFIASVTEPGGGAGARPLSGARILGIGHQVARGVRRGAVIDLDAAEMSIRRAVQAAETMAGERIDRVFVNQTGGAPVSLFFDVEEPIEGPAVGEDDLRRVLRSGRETEIDEGHALVHAIPARFSIDGARGIRDPRGMAGRRLGADIHMVTAMSGPLSNLSMAVRRCHLEVEGFVASPYASGLAALVEDERDLGATVIDMGGGATTVAVFRDGAAIFTDTIAIGGDRVTNDVALGLSTSVAEAERLKTLHGCAMLSPLDDGETLEVPLVGEDPDAPPSQVSKSMLIRIVQARLEEILETVGKRLEEAGMDRAAGRRAVLTGGASQMPGLRDLARKILDKQCRVGRPPRIEGLADAAAGPAFSTCAGVLAHALDPGFDIPAVRRPDRGAPEGAFGRIGAWLRENF